MLYLSSFFNNIVNQLIRNLDMSVRIIIAVTFLFLTVYSLMRFFKSLPDTKDFKSVDFKKIKWGWAVLAVITITISILYIIL